jgi:hypothetical protein
MSRHDNQEALDIENAYNTTIVQVVLDKPFTEGGFSPVHSQITIPLVIPEGKTAEFIVQDSNCVWNLKVQLADGTTDNVKGVDICSSEKITLGQEIKTIPMQEDIF